MGNLKITPLSDRILVIPGAFEEEGEKDSIRILLTEKEVIRDMGRVVAAGPGAKDASGKLIPMPVKVGDFVKFSQYGPEPINLDGQEYLILNASNVLAIISKEAAPKKKK
jgi:chaperonin GroES